MVKRKTRKFRKNSNRNTRKQKGGDLTMITPFLAIVAVCAAVSSTKGLDLNAISKEGGNLASGVKTQFNNAAAKAKAVGVKTTDEMKKQQAKIQHEMNKTKDNINTAATEQVAKGKEVAKNVAKNVKASTAAAAATAKKAAITAKDTATHAANTVVHQTKKAAGVPSDKPVHPIEAAATNPPTPPASAPVGSTKPLGATHDTKLTPDVSKSLSPTDSATKAPPGATKAPLGVTNAPAASPTGTPPKSSAPLGVTKATAAPPTGKLPTPSAPPAPTMTPHSKTNIRHANSPSPSPLPTQPLPGASPPKPLNNPTITSSPISQTSPLNTVTPPVNKQTVVRGGTKKYKKLLKQKRSRKYSR